MSNEDRQFYTFTAVCLAEQNVKDIVQCSVAQLNQMLFTLKPNTNTAFVQASCGNAQSFSEGARPNRATPCR